MTSVDEDITDDQKAEVLSWMAQYEDEELPVWLLNMRDRLMRELHLDGIMLEGE